MATATITVAPVKVHVEVPGFQGFGEFHGSTIDCSADAELMARHPLDGTPLDAATLNLFWSEYWNTGHHTVHGAMLRHIYWHLTASAHALDPSRARVARWIDTDTVSLSTLHSALIYALARGQTAVVYLGNAQALRYNERGVFGHFIALGGIDSDLGYLVGNGDDVNALGGHGIIPTRWYSWADLVAAQVNGMIALEKVTPPPPAPQPAPEPQPVESSPTYTIPVRLEQPTSLDDLANLVGGQLDWLKGWNEELASQEPYSKTWWTLPANTLVKLPYKKS